MRGWALVCFGLLLSACQSADDAGGDASAAAGPATVDVVMDAASPPGEQLTFTSYFPAALEVHAGDTIRFTNESDLGVPHTVTFGVASDRSNQPAFSLPEDPDGDNPVVAEPCFSADQPTPDLFACPQAAGSALALPAYDGTGYWNSGVGPAQVTLDAAIAPGDYPFLCVYHEDMSGLLQVVAADESVPSPADVAADGAAAQASAIERGDEGVDVPAADVGEGETPILTGWGSGAVLVQRFEPATLEVERGTTVTWVSPVYVHTVSVGVVIDGEVPESGVIGPFPELRSDRFSVTFTEAGTYPFVCTFHAGMQGELVVT